MKSVAKASRAGSYAWIIARVDCALIERVHGVRLLAFARPAKSGLSAPRKVWSWSALFMAALVLLLGVDSAMARNPWYTGIVGGQGCDQRYTGSSLSAITSEQQQCRVDALNAQGSARYTFTITGCSISQVTTWSQIGTGGCTVNWTVCDSGICQTYTPLGTGGGQCADGDLYIASANYAPPCKRVVDSYHFCPYCGQPGFGDPIYPLSGANVQWQDLGISLAGRPLKLTYDTAAALPVQGGLINMTMSPPPSFGALWTSSVHKQLFLETGGNASITSHGTAVLQRGSRLASFTIDELSNYAPTTDHDLKLTFADRYSATTTSTLLDASGLLEESYGANGAITQAANATGGWLAYAYSTTAIAGVAPAAGLLLSVTDHTGRAVSFTYEQPTIDYPPRINTITAPDSAVTQFGYDGKNNLSSITWPDTKIVSYRYERSDLAWALTGITDEASANYSTYDYDSTGRATGTHQATNVDSYNVIYSTNLPQWFVTETDLPDLIIRDHQMFPPSPTTVINGAGVATVLGSTSANGLVKLATQSVAAGSGSPAATLAQTYDQNGNVLTHVDLNGNLSCYAYDTSRDLETLRLEGLPGTVNGAANAACQGDLNLYVVPAPGAPGYDATHPQRKVTTQWHPDWALKVREAEPLKITAWVYNVSGASCAPDAPLLPDGKPITVVCSRTEQATSDATGGLGMGAAPVGNPRTWGYTYNQYGQVLTETGPAGGDGQTHTTTYAYYADTSFPNGVSGHTIGDLQSVTNAKSQTTQYTAYDKAGRLLSSTDPNNTVTTQTYWPRGWLHTVTVTPAVGAAQTTTYDYWPTGLLHVVTLPDTTTLTYAYDDAHRLTDVSDTAGNTVHYDLDNLGKRIGEQVKDASGNLASQVARAYDALSRLQVLTGAAH